MLRKMLMLFILTMTSSSAEENTKYGDEKETRFLSLFALTATPQPIAPPPPPRPASLQLGRCATRLESALEQIKRRQMTKARNSDSPMQMIDLDGYSLTQHLRSVPMDMYVTRMRVRLPQNQNWVRIDRCYFDPRNISLETRLLFNDLTISGSVNLQDSDNDLDRNEEKEYYEYDQDRFYDSRDFEGKIQYRDGDRVEGRMRSRRDYYDRNRGDCNMILRLRKAGIGFFTQPLNQLPGRFSVKTDSEFIEPGFISVYAYGCEKYITKFKHDIDRDYHDHVGYRNGLDKRHKRQTDLFRFEPYADNDDDIYQGRSFGSRDHSHYKLDVDRKIRNTLMDGAYDDFDISKEMEEIFTKGIRSLLTTYMQKELQPAIKETLIRNMGFTISYG